MQQDATLSPFRLTSFTPCPVLADMYRPSIIHVISTVPFKVCPSPLALHVPSISAPFCSTATTAMTANQSQPVTTSSSISVHLPPFLPSPLSPLASLKLNLLGVFFQSKPMFLRQRCLVSFFFSCHSSTHTLTQTISLTQVAFPAFPFLNACQSTSLAMYSVLGLPVRLPHCHGGAVLFREHVCVRSQRFHAHHSATSVISAHLLPAPRLYGCMIG